jgi:protein arginine N-methyltransferase 1
VWAAVAECPAVYSTFAQPWEGGPLGFEFSAARRRSINSWDKARLSTAELVTAPVHVADLDYTTVTEADLRASLTLVANRDGLAHGLCAWFETELVDGIGFSNSPGEPELIYGQAFFPFEQPVPVAAGDGVEVDLRADLIGDEYVWSWSSRFLDEDRANREKARFSQSTFYARLELPERLHTLSESYVPPLSHESEVAGYVLGLVDGRHSLGDIAKLAQQRFPERFASGRDALTYAGQLAREYRA